MSTSMTRVLREDAGEVGRGLTSGNLGQAKLEAWDFNIGQWGAIGSGRQRAQIFFQTCLTSFSMQDCLEEVVWMGRRQRTLGER